MEYLITIKKVDPNMKGYGFLSSTLNNLQSLTIYHQVMYQFLRAVIRKYYKLGGFKKTQIYSFTALEFRSPKSKHHQDHTFFEDSRGRSYLASLQLLVVASNPQCSLPWECITRNSVSIITWYFSCVSLCPNIPLLKRRPGISLVVQRLGLRTPNAGGLDLIPGQGTRSCMPQLKIPHAATERSCTPQRRSHVQLRPSAAK